MSPLGGRLGQDIALQQGAGRHRADSLLGCATGRSGRGFLKERAFPKLSFNENLVRFLDAASHRFGDIPTAEEFEAMVAEMDFDSQETKRPGHRGYGILAIHNP